MNRSLELLLFYQIFGQGVSKATGAVGGVLLSLLLLSNQSDLSELPP